MHTYRIRYKSGWKGIREVRADSINGFQPDGDTYLFKTDNDIVAAIPKSVVASIWRVDTGEDR